MEPSDATLPLVNLRAVLFDLDGTLADTAGDLAAALNRLLSEEGLPAQPYDAVRAVASHGARALIALAFGNLLDASEEAQRRARFLECYAQCLGSTSTLFDGIATLIQQLTHYGYAWGIVTNKPSRFTDALLPRLAFPNPPAVVVSGDTLKVAKPDPRPMWYAAEQLGIAPAHCLYIGDAKRDIDAGRDAGMHTVLATWGYLHHTDRPHTWGADHHIQHPTEVLTLLGY